jgi:hypothetical protein
MTCTSEKATLSKLSSPTKPVRCSMLPDPVLRGEHHIQSSTASSEPVQLYTFAGSGASGGSTLLGSGSSSLGASSISFERTIRNVLVVAAFGATVTFATDPAVATALAPTDLEIPDEGASAARASLGNFRDTGEANSLASIVRLLDEEPLEDGVTHRAERDLAAHIDQFGAANPARHFADLDSPSRAASLLRLFGRSEKIERDERQALLAWGLESPSVEVRDAAIQAAENWEGEELLSLLRRHHEPVPWLASYMACVIRDLGG